MFDNRRYAIDSYQREYKWQTKQLSNSSTIYAASSSKLRIRPGARRGRKYGHYFLGSIIVSRKKGQNYIIDGQQRLTTLTLFLDLSPPSPAEAAGRGPVDVSPSRPLEEARQEVLQHRRAGAAPCLETLYSGRVFDDLGRKTRKSVRNMVARYKEIEENFPADITEQALPYFLDWLINNVHLVEITAYPTTTPTRSSRR